VSDLQSLQVRLANLESEIEDLRAEMGMLAPPFPEPPRNDPFEVFRLTPTSVRVSAGYATRNGSTTAIAEADVTSISETGFIYLKYVEGTGWSTPAFSATSLPSESTTDTVFPIAKVTVAGGDITAVEIIRTEEVRFDVDTLSTNTSGVIDVSTTRDGPRAAFEVDHAIPEEDEDTVTSTLTMTPDDWIDIELLPDEAASRGVQIKRDLYGHIVGLRLDEFVFTHLFPVDPNGDETTLGAGEEGSETADTTTATISEVGAEGIAFWFVSRVVYDDAGDPPTLYAMMRKATFDARGHLFEVSGETAVSVDVTEDCTS